MVAASYVAALLNNPDHHALAEVRIRHKNGTWRIVESSGRLLPDGSLVGYSRDLIEHRRAEDALRERSTSV